MKNKRIIECPNCGMKHQFDKIEKGLTLMVPCLSQWDRSIGCGYVFSITLSEKKYGEK